MKEPDFYCEGCGTKVDKWAIDCPKCGRVFDSIKCPQCEFTGKANQFTNGCPVCGFQSKEQKLRMKQEAKARQQQEPQPQPKGKKGGDFKFSEIFYKSSIAVLTIVIIVLAAVLIGR
ncbi:MAG: zinc ribbon domain-containing protein [Spirochaetales bacterium]|nr:zinc ribbon domain-containing protein [Spirochaetales bacterium]